MNGWVGVDFDGTLATYHKGMAPALGEPIPQMVARVKRWLENGIRVKILTARASHPSWTTESHIAMSNWCREHLGVVLPITCEKSYEMIELWDDRAVQVESNTGRVIGASRMGWV